MTVPAGLVMSDVKAELFKAMGHPARIQLLEMLADGPVAVSTLRQNTGLEPSNLSQHLGVLRRQRLIVPARRDGRLFYELCLPRGERPAGRRPLPAWNAPPHRQLPLALAEADREEAIR